MRGPDANALSWVDGLFSTLWQEIASKLFSARQWTFTIADSPGDGAGNSGKNRRDRKEVEF
jgi:hypothetical protein